MRYRYCAQRQTVRKRILILCEGGKTEPGYFKAIKADKYLSRQLVGLRIVVHNTKKNTAKELVAQAIYLKKEAKHEKNPYDDVWVVVDRDGYTKHPESFDRARQTDICIGFSSPCFEYWILLHYVYTSSPFDNCDAVIVKLQQYIPEYNKAENYFDDLKERIEAAITHGNRIKRHWEDIADGPIWQYNPYTDVGELVNKLINL